MSLLRKPQVFGALIGILLFLLVATAYSGVIFLMSGNAWQQVQEGRFSLATFFFERGNYFFEGDSSYDPVTALANYKRALAFENSDQKPIHYQIGRIYFIKGELMRAVFAFNLQLEADPTFMRSYYMRGLTYGYLGEYTKAQDDFKKFLEWRPDSWAAHNDLVWVYFLAGDYDNAEQYARQGLRHTPANGWLANALGAILINQGKPEEARPYLVLAEEAFATMSPEQWGTAYPGNDPRVYEEGLAASRQSVAENLQLLHDATVGE